MHHSAARDVAAGLRAEVWGGGPNRIGQLSKVAAGRLELLEEQGVRTPRGAAPRGAGVARALAELMRHLGKKEVNRVYGRVFGERPNDDGKE